MFSFSVADNRFVAGYSGCKGSIKSAGVIRSMRVTNR